MICRRVDLATCCFVLLLSCLPLLPATAVQGEPLDLFDPRPRQVVVEFEVSPRHLPHQTDSTYTRALPAWLEPGDHPGVVRVIVPGRFVEEYLMADQRPVRNSFSDFVWTFDADSGRVTSATLVGELMRTVDWGIMTRETNARIEVEMATSRPAGFRAPTQLLGHMIFRHCNEPEDTRCNVVDSTPYDVETGYVNVPGMMRVRSSFVEVKSFSPLGEAIFSEFSPRTRPVTASIDSAIEHVSAPPPESLAELPGDTPLTPSVGEAGDLN